MTQTRRSAHPAASFPLREMGMIPREDELNQQVEVRQYNGACVSAFVSGGGTPPPNANYHANAAQIKNPNAVSPAAAVTACYGTGILVEKNVYGPDGMRTTREVYDSAGAPKRSVHVRLGGNVVDEFTEEYNSAAASFQQSHTKAYIYGPLGLLATEEFCSFSCKSDETMGVNVTRYYEYDHLGTIRAITDNTGKLETTFDYEPFGLELKGTTFTWGTDTSSNSHKFTGHERDEEAGEDYMKARMYVLSTARFPQIDPMFGGIGDPQNWNAYIYVGNSPVGSSDPTGMLQMREDQQFQPSSGTSSFDTPGSGAGPVSAQSTVATMLGITVGQVQALLTRFTMAQLLNYAYNGVDATTTVVAGGSPSISGSPNPGGGTGAQTAASSAAPAKAKSGVTGMKLIAQPYFKDLPLGGAKTGQHLRGKILSFKLEGTGTAGAVIGEHIKPLSSSGCTINMCSNAGDSGIATEFTAGTTGPITGFILDAVGLTREEGKTWAGPFAEGGTCKATCEHTYSNSDGTIIHTQIETKELYNDKLGDLIVDINIK